ncbi:MAG: diacylglycerol kinase family lipid kinase [Planctomycetota bacterium]|nr:MAG: diacylglycerol kinase family lipid kinase [Planctomycetota bacterium]
MTREAQSPKHTPHFRRALIVANPIAGRGRARRMAGELAAGLRADGIETELHFTAARGDATRRVGALEPETDLVVAVGGDGTVAEILAGLRPEIPLAVLPLGTANVMSRDLRIPRRPAGTIRMIRGGRTTGLDTARVNGRLSFLVTGVGFDGRIVRSIDIARSGPVTKWTYVRAVWRTLRAWGRPPRLRVFVDGERIPGEYGWVIVSNTIGYGGFMQIAPDRVLDDGLFEVSLFERGTRLALIGYALRGIFRRLPGGSCRMVPARRVRIESDEPEHYQVDGDYGGETPVEIEVTGVRHRLLIP